MTKLASIMAIWMAWAAWAAWAAGATACQSGEGPSAPDPAPAPDGVGGAGGAGSLYAEPAIDLGASVSSGAPAALALAYDGAAFRGGHATHDVVVVDGIVDVTPWHRDPATGQRRSGGAIGLSTTGAAVGETELSIGAGAARQVAQNVVEISRGALVERITNREDGIEQAWRLDAPPAGGGALTVEVAVAGHRFVAATVSGLHFQSERGLGFRYSHAVWRDASGAAWDIEARYEAGRIAITVPDEILAGSL
ncbi:MAG TPA: hypothetical protein VNO30_30035, partial [Kofleriaceae bacterium]|nr:hypothetical protein [Kofleriaceae bacterium]